MGQNWEFFEDLGVLNEYQKMKRFKGKRKISRKVVKEFFRNKIEMVKNEDNLKLFEDIKQECSVDFVNLVINMYINDKVAMKIKVEEKEVMRRLLSVKDNEIDKLNKEYQVLLTQVFE